ncbi:MAG: PCMD domain-containing protein, partial [Bacteroidales bacterium]|nr:PCMD domain-containing protein [Candidatus Scybalocola fimicaballi]
MSKFNSIISLFATAALGVSATYADGVYQIPNGNADMEWTNDNEPGGGLHSFYNASLGSGVLLSTGKKTAISQTTKVAGRTGNAVQLVSKSVMGIAKANGNLTTGNIFMGSTTPTNKANHNETRRSLGADGSLEFAGLPDSLEFYAKYTRGEKGDYNGNVNAFLHGDIDFADPAPDGFPTKEDYVVAFLEFPITPCDDWTRFSSAFEYYTPAKVDMATDTRYMLMNMTTNPIPGSTANDKLIVDDIRFIYNSKLNSLTYDGVDLLGGNKDAYKLSVDGEYDASKLAYEADGRGASVVSAYDEASKALTITVKGNDVAVDANNFHTYEVVFVSEN